MAEYIERASIVGALTSSDAQAKIRAMTGEEAYAYFLRLVNTAPTADVAPVRHEEQKIQVKNQPPEPRKYGSVGRDIMEK